MFIAQGVNLSAGFKGKEWNICVQTEQNLMESKWVVKFKYKAFCFFTACDFWKVHNLEEFKAKTSAFTSPELGHWTPMCYVWITSKGYRPTMRTAVPESHQAASLHNSGSPDVIRWKVIC